ncbi:MAG TPA: carboxypeptidase regulatory-like domain-containing protein, partial [Vicinamibacteria bacterium]
MSLLLAFAMAAGAAAAPAEFVVSGTVRAALGGEPLAGARVRVQGGAQETAAGADGSWRLRLPAGDHVLEVTHPGYLPLIRALAVAADVVLEASLESRYRVSEEVVVQAVRAEARTPVTKHEVDRADIDRRSTGQEMPFLLKPAPSVNQYSDTGLGSGYSYLYLRGIQQTRVNMTLDGVPLNEPEDSTVYFVNFGDLAGSLESIQVQRGVGTSTVGVASYAGSINFASRDLAEEREASARAGAGSFGSRRASAGLQSGRLGSGLAFHGRASYLETDGFKQHSGVRQRSAFVGGTRQGARDLLKFFAFGGRERSQLAFYATPQDALERDLRSNPASPEERDSFGQGFAHAHYTRSLGDSSSLGVQGYYGGAGGWYRLQNPAGAVGLLEYGLRWRLKGALATFRHAGRELSLTVGVHGNDFGSRHTR